MKNDSQIVIYQAVGNEQKINVRIEDETEFAGEEVGIWVGVPIMPD